MSDLPAYPAQRPWIAGSLPVLHGFSIRGSADGRGHEFGTSQGPFSFLNLGLSSGDEEAAVEQNRDALLEQLGFGRSQVCAFHQVHSDAVLDGQPSWFAQKADAAVTDDPNTLLVVSVADCLPVLLHDPASGAVGAAHCGWRGTVTALAAKVVQHMAERFGSRPENLRALFGPGIAGACYQVGPEVIRQFEAAGFSGHVYWTDRQPDRYRLDIKAANRWLLETSGVGPHNIVDLDLCTHCRPELFYSYRRDGGVTGRHWAFISPRPAP